MNIDTNFQEKCCIFCQIVRGERPSKILIENEFAIVISDVNPLSIGHSLIITKKHSKNLLEIDQNTWNNIFPLFKKLTEDLIKSYFPKGFNFISNIGKEAYQSVDHLHIHLIPKYNKEDGFIWTSN